MWHFSKMCLSKVNFNKHKPKQVNFNSTECNDAESPDEYSFHVNLNDSLKMPITEMYLSEIKSLL